MGSISQIELTYLYILKKIARKRQRLRQYSCDARLEEPELRVGESHFSSSVLSLCLNVFRSPISTLFGHFYLFF